MQVSYQHANPFKVFLQNLHISDYVCFICYTFHLKLVKRKLNALVIYKLGNYTIAKKV